MLSNLTHEMRVTSLLIASRSQLARRPHLMAFHHCRHHYHVLYLRPHRPKFQVVSLQMRLVAHHRFPLCHLQPAKPQVTRMKMTTTIHSSTQHRRAQHLQHREQYLPLPTASRLRRKVVRRHLCLRPFPQYLSSRQRTHQMRMICTLHHSPESRMIGRRLHRLSHQCINMHLHPLRPWNELRRHLPLQWSGLHLQCHSWTVPPRHHRRR
jgi:hypothetical protein